MRNSSILSFVGQPTPVEVVNAIEYAKMELLVQL
jgi:hypothetical protein